MKVLHIYHLMKYRDWYACLQTSERWIFHGRALSAVTPRSLCCDICGIRVSSTV